MAKAAKISLCMIVKNEENNIERCLKSVKDHVYEMIVVDTGSTDRTVELAEALGARVYYFKWINDFAAARNFSISKAKGDWILWLDADEYITEPNILNIKRMLKILSEAHKQNTNTPKIIVTAIANLDYNGVNCTYSSASRLFKRDSGVRFEGRIHEQAVVPQNSHIKRYNAMRDIAINHTGYTKEAYEETGKLERNEALLIEELKNDPENARLYSFIADIYGIRMDYAKALKYYKTSLGKSSSENDGWLNNRLYFNVLIMMTRLGTPENDILAEYEKARESDKGAPDFDYQLAVYYIERKNNVKALFYMENAIEKAENLNPTHYSEILPMLPTLYKTVVDTAILLEQWDKAIKYMVCLLKANRFDMQLLKVFMSVLLLHGGAPEEEIVGLLLNIYDRKNAKDKLYMYKAAQLCNNENPSQRLVDLTYELFTDEEKAMLAAPPKEEQPDEGFVKLMEKIAQMDENALFELIKKNFKKLPENLRVNLADYYCKYEFWGRLEPKKAVYDVFSNRAKELKEHFSDFLWLYEQLGDARSKNVLYGILNNWVSMDFKTLDKVKERKYPDYFDGKLISCTPDEVFVDLGGFNGDTVFSFAKTYGQFKRIYTYEITPSVMEQLKKNTAGIPNVEARLKAAGDAPGKMFVSDGSDISANTLSASGNVEVEVVRIDDDITEPITFLKMDIEGSEQAALRGSERHIKEDHPKLTICTYHNNRDIWQIPRMIREMCPDYKLFMRYNGGNLVPTEYVLFAL